MVAGPTRTRVISSTPFAELGNEMASVFTTISSLQSSAKASFINCGRLLSFDEMHMLIVSVAVMERHDRLAANRLAFVQLAPNRLHHPSNRSEFDAIRSFVRQVFVTLEDAAVAVEAHDFASG